MISPQEPGKTITDPHAGQAYLRKLIGAQIAAEILAACERDTTCDSCRYCAAIARGDE